MNKRETRGLLTAVLAAALSTCGQSPDDLFVLGGRTVSETGAPLDGIPIQATRKYGGACNDGSRLKETTSADGGLFSFDFVRVEVQSLSEATTTCVRVGAAFESGAQAWTDMYFFPNRLVLPDFSDWRGGLSFNDAGVPRFTPVLPESAPMKTCEGNFPKREERIHGLVARSDGGSVWETSDRVLRFSVDDAGVVLGETYEPYTMQLTPETLEDFDVDVSLQAKRLGCVEVSGGGSLGMPGPFVTHTRWASAGTVRARGTKRPVSRGARCDDFLGACPLTDGSPLAAELPRPMNQFRIRLTRPASISAIVIRNGLTDTGLVPNPALSIRVGTDSLTVPLAGLPDVLDQIQFLEDGSSVRRTWLYVPLPRPVGDGVTVELELDRVFFRLGEISLFE